MDERVKAMERAVQKVADAQAEVGRAITMMAGLEQRLAVIEAQGRTATADNRRAAVSGLISFAVGLAVAGVVAYFRAGG